MQDAAGNLYGTADEGGTYDDGTVFEIAKGSGTITTLANFDYTDGADPKGGMVLDAAGNLYGTTEYGGGGGYGTVFEIVKGSDTITTLASFNSADGPDGGLVLDAAGNLYGTTGFGGAYGDGTVFEVAHGAARSPRSPASTARTERAHGGLVQDAAGNLYGTTDGGLGRTGSVETGDGTLFEIAHGSGTITTLASFDGADGASPNGSLLLDTAGNLYGTTAAGGAGYSDTFPGLGTVFELANLSDVADLGFQSPYVGAGPTAYQYDPTGSSWTFTGTAGLAGNGSALTAGNPAAPQGTQIAFIQDTGQLSQAVSLEAGTYTVSLAAAERELPGQQPDFRGGV